MTRTALEAAIVRGAALAGCALLVVAAGQPIFSDDVWWHLALGRSFWAEGPRLAADPLLFAPAAAPSPAAWLADLSLFGVAHGAGFGALRALHVALVAASLALAGSLARRASGSAAVASAVLLVFVALAAYRVCQLRPELATILATLALYRLLVEPQTPPAAWRIAAAAALAALWANLHAAFVLGPLLLAAAAGGAAAQAWLGAAPEERSARRRALRLALAAGLAGLATLANPRGAAAWFDYFAAGAATPELALVRDEWARFPLFAAPTPSLPPSPLAWALVWALLGGSLVAAFAAARRRLRVDPALAAVAALSLALVLLAVRFSWLGIFPALLLAQTPALRSAAAARWSAVGCVAGLAAFVWLGDWPMLTQALPTTAAGYAKPYPASKWFGHAIWLLRDAELRGNLYTDYTLGGFAGWWLAPPVKTLVNGSLNVPPETLVALDAIAGRRGARPGESFPALLDRLGLDLFLGIRPPEVGHPTRPWASTTAHLGNAHRVQCAIGFCLLLEGGNCGETLLLGPEFGLAAASADDCPYQDPRHGPAPFVAVVDKRCQGMPVRVRRAQDVAWIDQARTGCASGRHCRSSA